MSDDTEGPLIDQSESYIFNQSSNESDNNGNDNFDTPNKHGRTK